MVDAPNTVWNEITISQSGIGITLYSESAGSGAVVEDEVWFTFDELDLKTGEIHSLNLSDITEESINELKKDATRGKILSEDQSEFSENTQSENLPSVGDLVEDSNPPSWSEDNRLKVVEIPDETTDEYVVEERPVYNDKTVADVNPSCDPDEPVVICEYVSGNDKEYAFPLSRLSL